MMDTDGTISEAEHKALTHHRKVMNTALELLRKFKKAPVTEFTGRQVTYGADTTRRCGKVRTIQFLQVGEPTGAGDLELRIEVFVVKKGETI